MKSTKKLEKENSKLRDVVSSRTAELRAKKHELKIEAALEKVRMVAMGMKKPADMLKICKTIAQQMRSLGVKEIRNVQTAVIDTNKGTYLNFEFYAKHNKLLTTEVDYTDHPMTRAFVKQMLSGPDGFFKKTLKGKKVQEWYKFQKNTNQFADKYLAKASSLNYYWYSLGPVALGVSTYEPLSEAEQEVLKRFRKVFALSYRRYLDIEKAEAQAREAEIELGLERVRAKTMAMHRSSDLLDVIPVLAEQFQLLGFNIHSVNVNTTYRDKDWHLWLYNPGMPMYPDQLHIPYFDHPFFNRTIESLANGSDFNAFVFTREEKNGFLDHLYSNTNARAVSEERKKFTYEAPGFAWSAVYMNNTAVTIANYDAQPYTEEQNTILRRFGNVFEQTYVRFLDLQKAEGQAREAQIQLAMERVRARTMAMQKSDELAEAASLLFQQVQTLGVKTYSSGFTVWDNDDKDLVSWMCNADGSINPPFRMPANDIAWHRRQYESWKKGEDLIVNDFTGEEMQSHYRYLRSFPLLDEAFRKSETAGIKTPKRQVHNIANFSHGNLLFITFEPCLEFHDIFKRFAKVFEQTYVRFLDLQEAEAQAREAQIQLALEKVRARTMAMQKSDELSETAAVLFQQFKELGDRPIQITIGIFNEKENVIEFRITSAEGLGSKIDEKFNASLDEPTLMRKIFVAWKAHKKSVVITLSGQELTEWIKYRSNISGEYAYDSKIGSDDTRFVAVGLFSKGVISFSKQEPVAEETIQILERFAGVFDLTYTRFLDLEKAEAQAREAEI
ncbi:MAG TPA: hypothetical protein VFP87_14095, partial [Chitinophagaceae bacterium]|nr:hypothetical protein [Chitinophagaceae bacterium]